MNIKFTTQGNKAIKKLYVRFYHNRLDLLVDTNVKVLDSDWNSEAQSVNNNPELNLGLADLKSSILRSYNRDFVNGVIINSDWLKKVIRISFMRPKTEDKLVNPNYTIYVSEFCQFWMDNYSATWKTSSRKTMSPVLKSQYLKFVEILKDYEKTIGEKLQLRSLSVNEIQSFVEYLETEDYQVSTVARYIGRLRFFLNRSEESNIETNKAYKQRIYFGEEPDLDGVYLNEQEIQSIFELDLTHDEELDNVRDLLIISVWTACRVSDLMTNLKIENIKDGIISIKTQKTGVFVKIPVHFQVKSVLDKRFGMLPRKMNASDYNLKIKTVCQLAKIDNLVYGKLFNSKTKRKELGYHSKYLLCSSHIARKSFATNLSGKVDDEVIMSAAGWKTSSMKAHYDKTSKLDQARKLEQHWNLKN